MTSRSDCGILSGHAVRLVPYWCHWGVVNKCLLILDRIASRLGPDGGPSQSSLLANEVIWNPCRSVGDSKADVSQERPP